MSASRSGPEAAPGCSASSSPAVAAGWPRSQAAPRAVDSSAPSSARAPVSRWTLHWMQNQTCETAHDSDRTPPDLACAISKTAAQELDN